MRRMRNLNLDSRNQVELQISIESILEILMALNEEIVKKWIKEKYPGGIGLYDTIAPPIRKEPSEKLPPPPPMVDLAATIKDTFSCAVCIMTKPVIWCETHERFECDDCHANEQKENPIIID